MDLRHYGHDDLGTIRQILINVHDDIPEYQVGNEFDDRFPWFVDHWGSNPGFRCVIGFDATEPVGFAYGAPQTPGREWWRDTSYQALADESTFAISEIMVRPPWRKTGAAEKLHEALLRERPEAQAVLLVDVAHPKVATLYESWGYKKIGEQKPFADSPLYAIMLRKMGRAVS